MAPLRGSRDIPKNKAAYYECNIDGDLCSDIGEFDSLPHLDLPSQQFEVPSHAVDFWRP